MYTYVGMAVSLKNSFQVISSRNELKELEKELDVSFRGFGTF